MCGGGGGAPPPVDPLEEANAQILIQQNQAKLDAETRATALAQQAAQLETDTGNFNTSLDTAFQGALGRGTAAIEERGLDPNDFLTSLTSELEGVRRSVPFLDPNPGSFFGNDIADIVLNRAQDTQRRGFRNDLNEFAGAGFAQSLFPGTADDSILQSILTEQFTPASDQLLRAFQRGNLTQQGFDTATNQLGSQKEAGLARLSDVGGGVLGDFRNQLKEIGQTGFGRADAFELGGSFDPQNTKGLIDAKFSDLTGNLGGRLRNAIGGEQLFNIEDLLTRGGISQGAQNPNSGLLDQFATRQKEKDKQRGLGSAGVF